MIRRSTILASLVALVGTAGDVGSLVGLVHAGVPIAAAVATGVVVANLISYLGNKYIAFRDPAPMTMGQVARYAGIVAVTATVLAGAVHALALWGVPYLIGKAVCHTLLFFVWSLPAQRRWVFPLRAHP